LKPGSAKISVYTTPSAADWPRGRDGARRMIAAFAAMADLKLEVLDAVEEGDRVAVRWQAAWTDSGERREASILAIYRFKDGLIAEDWGLSARVPWPGD
jgi:predicted SnoaL-like aldol condensation-catalyzing enzyme